MIKLKKFEFLIKYVLSYFAILMIPLCIMFLFIYNRFFKIMEEDILKTSFNNILQIRNTIDRNINRIDESIRIISSSFDLNSYSMNSSFFNYYSAVKRINEIKNSNDFISSIILSIKGNDIIITDVGTIDKEFFGIKSFEFEKLHRDQLLELFNTVKQKTVLKDSIIIPGIGKSDSLFYLYPVTSAFGEPDALIAVAVNISNILKNVANELDNKNRSIFVIDENQNIVCKIGEFNTSIIRQLMNTEQNKYSESRLFKVDNNRYCISYTKSIDTGWIYISIVDYDSIGKDIKELRNVMFFIFLVLLICGNTTIFFFVRLNYNPIRNLTRQVQSIVVSKTSLNEVETIKTAVNNLIQDVDVLSLKVKTAKPAMYNFVVMSLLKKRIKSIDELNKITSNYGFVMDKEYFAVAVVVLSRCIIFSIEEMNQEIDEISDDAFDVYLCEDTSKQELLLLINTVSGDLELNAVRMSKLADNIKKLYNDDVTIGLGNAYSDLNMIPKSYMEAYISTEYQNLVSSKRVITFEEFTHSDFKDQSMSSIIKDFEFYIIRNDIESIIRFPKNLITNIENEYLSVHRANTLVYDIIRIIGKNISDSKEGAVTNKKLWDHVYKYLPLQSIDNLEELLVNICSELTQYLLNRQKEQSEDVLLQDILKYLQENCTKADFSLQQIEEDLNISPSRASHYFKNNMKMTLIEYVTERKMEKAKSMLNDESVSLNAITESLGYSNSSSFIRSFKKIVGMTPGQYRKYIVNKKSAK